MTNEYFIIFVAFVIGSCIGSFLNVCIYRLPLGISILSPPSACPKCKKIIKPYENIPIISYILLRGRCSSCNESISIRYPLVELLTGIMTSFLYLEFKLTPQLLIYALFTYSLIVVSFIDLSHQIIPDEISLPGIILGLVSSLTIKDITFVDSFLGILFGGGTFYLIALLYYYTTKKEGLGGGDIKLMAMIGAFLGWKAIPFVILCSAILGTTIGYAYIRFFKRDDDPLIPYGPFLSLASVIFLFFREEILLFYFNPRF